jgi:hypothetical protein
MSMNAEVWRVLTDSPEILEGIRSGIFKIWGGVIRHASGSPEGGQIVGHLKFPSEQQVAQQSIENLQAMLSQGFESAQTAMGGLQQSMNMLQGLQVANLALSGLNLAVSVAGFAIVCSKLNKLSAQVQAQSININQILEIVCEARDRALFSDEAQFRSHVISAKQFSEQGDTQQLKSLLPAITKDYEFNRLILQNHAIIAASSIEHLSTITLFQERLVHIGLLRSHVQMKVGAPQHAEESLNDLLTELPSLNAARVEHLLKDEGMAARMPADHFPELLNFLDQGKAVLPALSYESSLIALERSRPGALGQSAANDSSQILILPVRAKA